MNEIIYFLFTFLIEGLIVVTYGTLVFERKTLNGIAFLGCLFFIPASFLALINHPLINSISVIICCMLIFILIFRQKPLTAAIHSGLQLLVMAIAESVFFSFMYSDIHDNRISLRIIIITVLSKLLYLFIDILLGSLFKKQKDNPEYINIKFLLILSMFPSFLIFIVVSYTYFNSAPNTTLSAFLLISSVALLMYTLFITFFYRNVMKASAEHTKLKMMYQKEADITEYYKLLAERNNLEKQLIHDYKNHINSAIIMLNNNDYDGLSKYLTSLTDTPVLSTAYSFSDNNFLNYLISLYASKCNNLNISFKTDIRKSAVDFMNTPDITSIFCNLLDNACEAASLCENGFIDLFAEKSSDDKRLTISVINSCKEDPFSNGKLITHKDNKSAHGIGLKSIEKTCKKYCGMSDYYYDATTHSFHSILVLYSPLNANN